MINRPPSIRIPQSEGTKKLLRRIYQIRHCRWRIISNVAGNFVAKLIWHVKLFEFRLRRRVSICTATWVERLRRSRWWRQKKCLNASKNIPHCHAAAKTSRKPFHCRSVLAFRGALLFMMFQRAFSWIHKAHTHALDPGTKMMILSLSLVVPHCWTSWYMETGRRGIFLQVTSVIFPSAMKAETFAVSVFCSRPWHESDVKSKWGAVFSRFQLIFQSRGLAYRTSTKKWGAGTVVSWWHLIKMSSTSAKMKGRKRQRKKFLSIFE